MAFLTQFLELSSSDAQKKQALESPEFKEWRELKRQCDTMLERRYFTGEYRNLSNPEKLVLKKEDRLLNTIWKKYQYLPRDMTYSALGTANQRDYCTRNPAANTLAEFSEYPLAKLIDLREAADKLSLMILPLSYFDEGKLEQIQRELSYSWCSSLYVNQIKSSFSQIASYTMQDLYALCPVHFYNMVKAEQDSKDHEIFFGGELVRTKTILDTISKIQKNLFAMLRGDAAGTEIWEIGEGCECSKIELMHLKVIIDTIMPIQHDLYAMAQQSKDMGSWVKTMQTNHHAIVSDILHEISQQMSWSKQACELLGKQFAYETRNSQRASWVIPEAVAMTNVLIFALPHEVSLVHGDGCAKIIKACSVNMPEAFYLSRGFTKQNNQSNPYSLVSEAKISLN